jgi:Fe-S cluster biogenesis protein NfuA
MSAAQELAMASTVDERAFRQRVERLEALLQGVERHGDPAAQASTREIVQSLMDLHGVALERMLGLIAGAGEPGLAVIDALARDDLVGSLLLLYGLHPLDLETRVRQALDDVRPHLRAHGGDVALLGIVGGVVRLRMEVNSHGCPSSAAALKLAVEEAICGRAPDAAGVEVEGVVEEQPRAAPSTFVPVEQLRIRSGPAPEEARA